jgi:anti-anti-sigma regulatory factor
MTSFALSESNGDFEITVLDGSSLNDDIFDELKQAIESDTGAVVINFAKTPYVNAVFLNTLKKLQKSLERKKRRLVLTNLSETMEEILRVVDFCAETRL